MIPFFRRIRKKMADDNKTLKYMRYAIGEIVLVMVGILLALQVNNWNVDRKNVEKEKYYLNSIKTSIQMSQNELNRVIADAEMISASADSLLRILAHNKYDQLEGISLDILLFSASDYSIMSLNDGGIREILNTGSLDLIKDEQIRVLLASWDERIHKVRKYESETEYIAHNYGEYLMNFVDVSRVVIDSLNSVIIPEKKEQLLTDPRISNYLSKIWGTHRGMNETYTQEKIVLDSLNSLINQYLKE